jgi:nucleotide-binding universal stress UspA family protein
MPDQPASRIVICFDGSEGSQRAIAAAGRLFPGARATVTHVWLMPMMPAGAYPPGENLLPLELDEETQRVASMNADEVAEQGASMANEAGLVATGRSTSTTDSVWPALLEVADDVKADAIVVGSRGLTGIKSVLLGSTSSALAHHSDFPVLIVPPA